MRMHTTPLSVTAGGLLSWEDMSAPDCLDMLKDAKQTLVVAGGRIVWEVGGAVEEVKPAVVLESQNTCGFGTGSMLLCWLSRA